MSMWCFYVNTIVVNFLKNAVNQRQFQKKLGLKSLVFLTSQSTL